MDELHLLQVFVAVVDANGFAGAARKLSLSPPAITRAINELERRLGLRLLTRTTRVVRVTDAGERYAQDCRRIMTELVEARDSVQGMHSAPRGKLSITASVMFGEKYVTPIVTEYLQRYPEVSAECIWLDRVVNMMDEGVDVAIRIGELPDSSMQAIRVGSVQRIICAAPSYLKQHGTPRKPQELVKHRIISARPISSTAQWQLNVDGRQQTIKLHPRLSTTTNEAAINAAVNGFGITRLLSYQIAEQLRDGRLKALLTRNTPEDLPVHVVHREGRQGTQRVRAFLDLAIERLQASLALR